MNATTKQFKKIVVSLEKATGENLEYAKKLAREFVATRNLLELSKQNLLQLSSLQYRYEFMNNAAFLYFFHRAYIKLFYES